MVNYQWTDGNNNDFQMFYQKTEEYYSKIVGGLDKRKAFNSLFIFIVETL